MNEKNMVRGFLWGKGPFYILYSTMFYSVLKIFIHVNLFSWEQTKKAVVHMLFILFFVILNFNCLLEIGICVILNNTVVASTLRYLICSVILQLDFIFLQKVIKRSLNQLRPIVPVKRHDWVINKNSFTILYINNQGSKIKFVSPLFMGQIFLSIFFSGGGGLCYMGGLMVRSCHVESKSVKVSQMHFPVI